MNIKNNRTNIAKNFTKKTFGVFGITAILLGLSAISGKFISNPSAYAAPPDGSTFTVNSTANDPDADLGDGICETANSGECTLVAAIAQASINGNPTFRDIIEFNIPGAGVQTISPDSLIDTGQEPLLINGYTQPGSSANTNLYPDPLNGTLLIEVDFSNLSTPLDSGFVIHSGFAMTGLVLNSNPVGNTISAYLTDDVSIYGNYFNTDATGLVAKAGSSNMSTLGINGGTNINIGGSQPEERNLFGSNGGSIYMFKAEPGGEQTSDVSIKGNYFGVGADGVTNLGTLQWQHIAVGDQSSDITIGGPNTEDGNSVENAQTSGISIGSNADSDDGSVERVLIQNNRIHGNGTQGVSIGDYEEPYGYAQNISVLQNSIYLNGVLSDSIGIDIVLPSGTNSNDELDVDTGSNGMLNSPNYINGDAVESGGDTYLKYGLDVPGGEYRIEFFASPSQVNPQDLEGYEFIGSQDVTSLGSGYQQFNVILSGDGHQNITMTATEINTDLPSGFGATSEFGTERARVSDVSIEKELLNPEDIAQGVTLNYQVTYTNNGPDEANLVDNSVVFGSPALFVDYLPPDLTIDPATFDSAGPLQDSYYIEVGNPDELTCLWTGPNTAALFGMVAHPDYSAVACWYTGSDSFLADGANIQANISTQVANDSSLAFINLVLADTEDDPDSQIITEQVLDGADILDGIYRNTVGLTPPPHDNIAITPLPQDIDVSAELVNPEDASTVGATISYDITLTNNHSVTGFDLSHYFNLPMHLLSGAYAANKVSLVGSPTANTNCGSLGPGSTAYWGAAASNHGDHQLWACSYQGASQVLAPGQSYTLRLNFTVNEASSFNLYVVAALQTPGDPDRPGLVAAIYGASEDVLDTITNQNYARVTYASGQTGEGGNNQNSSGNAGSSSLSGTGEDRKRILYIAIAVLAAGGIASVAALLVKKHQKTSKK